MNSTLRLSILSVLAFTVCSSTTSQAQIRKLDNEFFQLELQNPDWLIMSNSSLLDKSDYASASSGRTIKYLAGLTNVTGETPYIIFQQSNTDLGTVDIKEHLRGIADKASLPTFIHEKSSPLPYPQAHAQMHFNLHEEYALMTNEVVVENEPCVNISYMIPHGKGLMYMHCYSHVMDTEVYYPQFDQIRKDLRFIFPTLNQSKSTASTQTDTTGEAENNSGGGNWPKYVFMALAVMLLLFILGRVSKPRT